MFGRQLPDNNVWVDGVVSKWLRDSTLTRDTMAELLTSQFSDKQRIARMMGSLSHVKKWLVLDGPMDDTWLENMGTLLDSTRALNLPSGETISQPGELKVSFNGSILVVEHKFPPVHQDLRRFPTGSIGMIKGWPHVVSSLGTK